MFWVGHWVILVLLIPKTYEKIDYRRIAIHYPELCRSGIFKNPGPADRERKRPERAAAGRRPRRLDAAGGLHAAGAWPGHATQDQRPYCRTDRRCEDRRILRRLAGQPHPQNRHRLHE